MARTSALWVILAVILVGCSSSNSHPASDLTEERAGSLLISRPLPQVFNQSDLNQGRSLGFVPISPKIQDACSLDLNRRKIRLYSADGKDQEFNVLSVSDLKPGDYPVLMVVKDPLWYAADSYYTARGLDLPKAGSKERYLRGALGDSAIFLSDSIAIYSSNLSSGEITGIRVEAQAIEALSAALRPGSSLTIR